MGRTGPVHPQFPAGNTTGAPAGGSNSGNKDAPFGDSAGVIKPTGADPLAAWLAACPVELPPAIVAGVLALVKAGTPQTPTDGR